MSNTISFVVASFNEAGSVESTLNSIIAVMQEADELIIIDGDSADGTQQIVQQIIASRPNVRFVSEADSGLYDAWNKAIEIASCEWIAFLGCGDLLHSNYRERMTEHARFPTTNFVHALGRFYHYRGEKRHNLQQFGGELSKKAFKKSMRICHVGALHHTSLFIDMRFSTEYRSVSDYHFLLKQLNKINASLVAEELIEIKSGGISTQTFSPILEELRMKKTLFGYNPFYFSFQLIEKVVRSQLSKVIRKVYYG